jgi:hypothetical protein
VAGSYTERNASISSTTLSGPASKLATACSLLTDAGYVVLDDPAMTWLELADDEALVSVQDGHSDVAAAVAHLGYRHRGTLATPAVDGLSFPFSFPVSFS